VLFIPCCRGYTSMTGASHRSDRCNPYWVFSRVNIWVCSLLSCVAAVSCLGRFGARLACLVLWGFLAVPSLTGLSHRPDRCGALCGSRQVLPAGTVLTGVGHWTQGLVFCSVLGSEGCVLVPRSSGTPVATWAWPTWVVSRRRVLEAVFVLESPSPSRRIFIGSHSLPPLWFAVSVLQSQQEQT
jgi:hypothetical protein